MDCIHYQFSTKFSASHGRKKRTYKFEKDEHLMILKSIGGEGGDQDEALRLVRFSDNYKLHEIYIKYVNYYQGENKKELTYQIQKQENRILIFTLELEPGEDGYYKNITTELDTLNIRFH